MVTLTTVAVILVAMANAVIRDKTAAVPIVAVTNVVVVRVVNPGKPAAVATAASVIAAMVTCAVAPLGKLAVTIQPAMTLQRKSVVDTEMVLYVIRWGNAVTRADV